MKRRDEYLSMFERNEDVDKVRDMLDDIESDLNEINGILDIKHIDDLSEISEAKNKLEEVLHKIY
jgi:hypothetical protein